MIVLFIPINTVIEMIYIRWPVQVEHESLIFICTKLRVLELAKVDSKTVYDSSSLNIPISF